jgi:hypothetical protein
MTLYLVRQLIPALPNWGGGAENLSFLAHLLLLNYDVQLSFQTPTLVQIKVSGPLPASFHTNLQKTNLCCRPDSQLQTIGKSNHDLRAVMRFVILLISLASVICFASAQSSCLLSPYVVPQGSACLPEWIIADTVSLPPIAL